MTGIIESTKEMFRDSRFLRKALMIACPVALQGMLNTVVNLVDTLMIGTLGATAIAAVGLANKVFFVFSLLVFGHDDRAMFQRDLCRFVRRVIIVYIDIRFRQMLMKIFNHICNRQFFIIAWNQHCNLLHFIPPIFLNKRENFLIPQGTDMAQYSMSASKDQIRSRNRRHQFLRLINRVL